MLNLKLLYAIIAITFTVLASCNSVSQIAPHAIEPSREINSPLTRYYEINNNLYRSKDIAGIEACKQAMEKTKEWWGCLLYTSPSPRDQRGSRMPSSA